MTAKKLKAAESKTEELMDASTFNIVQYLTTKTAYTDTVVIYVDVDRARKLQELRSERDAILSLAKINDEGTNTSLSITESTGTEEIDEQIEHLEKDLKDSALHFQLKSVPPSVTVAHQKKLQETSREDFDSDEAYANAVKLVMCELYVKTIVDVTTGDKSQTFGKMTPEALAALDNTLYREQSEKLVDALNNMLDIGSLFEDSVTADFL